MPERCSDTPYPERKNLNVYNLHGVEALATIKEMKSILEKHCSATGSKALLADPFQPMTDPVFTEDGFNIINSISYDTPEAKMIHRLVLYIGERIASFVGDGTTTGMLIALNILEYYIEKDLFKTITSIPFTVMRKKVDKFYEQFEKCINRFKYTARSVMDLFGLTAKEAFKAIAYHQTYTASHGDEELSSIISEMFASIPKEALGSVVFAQAGFETDWRYKLIEDDSQFSCQADILSTSMLNVDLKSRFFAEDCLVEVSNEGLAFQSPSYHQVYERMIECFERRQNYVHITTNACGVARVNLSKLFMELHNKLEAPSEAPAIAIIFIPIKDSLFNDAFILSLVGGVPMASPSSINTLPSRPSVGFDKGTLKIDKMYEGECSFAPGLRPMFNNPSYPQYNAVLKQLELNIHQCKQAENQSVGVSEQLQTYTRLKNILLLNRRHYVMIGGAIYDNVAAMHIVEDCVSAVRRSLTEGFVAGALISTTGLLHQIGEVISEAKDRWDDLPDEVFMDMYIKSVTQVAKVFLPDNIKIGSHDLGLSYDLITQRFNHLHDAVVWSDPKQNNIIIQPALTDLTIFKRVGEVILRALYTSDFIYTGG